MAGKTGKDLYLEFDSTQLDADYRSFDPDIEIDTVEDTTGSDDNKTYVTTTKDGTASATLIYQASGGGNVETPDIGDEGNLIWGPEGNTTGLKRFTVNAILTKVGRKHPYDGLIEYSLEWQFSGAVTEDTFP